MASRPHHRQRIKLAPAPSVAVEAKRSPWLLAIWCTAVALLAWSFGFTRMLNSDIWFHLAAGRLIVDTGTVPRVDPWSFTAGGQPWHNHEWLADVVFYLWSEWFGTESLVFWQWGLLALAAVVLFDLLRRWCAPAMAWLIVLVALVTASPFFDIRPHAWSWLAFILLLRATLVPCRGWQWLLPVLFLLWGNLHGGVVFGLMALALIVAAHQVRRPVAGVEPSALRRHGLLVFAGCVAATMVNPWGWRALAYPVELALQHDSPSRTSLVEWASPFRDISGIRSPAYVPCLLLALAAACVLLARWYRQRNPESLALVGLVLLTAAMSATSRRFIELFAIAAALVFAHVLPGRWLALPGRRTWVGLALALALPVYLLHDYPLGRAAFIPLTRTERMPEEEVRFALANGLSGKVFSYFLWGGYLHWRTAGQLRVFIDPRSETVFPPDVHRRYLTVANDQPGWVRVIEESGADFVLWPFAPDSQRIILQELLASGRWRMVYTGAQGALLARSAFALPDQATTPASSWKSWALARRALAGADSAAAEKHLLEAMNQHPPLPAACDELVTIQGRLGKLADAERTEERCRRMFPFPV